MANIMFLEQFSELSVKVCLNEKRERYLLVNQQGDVVTAFECEIGQSAVDFIYEQLFEQVTGFLQVSKEIVTKIKDGENDEWSHFDLLLRNLTCENNMHPFYCLLFSEVVNAYNRGMRDAQGVMLPDDHFLLLGKSLEEMKAAVGKLLDAQDKAPSGSATMCCYKEKAFAEPILLKNVYAEIEHRQEGNLQLRLILAPQTQEEIWNYLLMGYADANVRFRRCAYCKRFFATTGRGNPRFCERLIEGIGQSCRQVIPQQDFTNRVKTDLAVGLYMRAYKTMYARYQTKKISKDILDLWVRLAREKRDICSRGEITPEEYSAWLCDNGLYIDYLKEGKL